MSEWNSYKGYKYKIVEFNNGRKEEWVLEFKDKKIPPMDILSKLCEDLSYLFQSSIIPYPEKGTVCYYGWID